jgi:perosamine synthetase
LPGHNYRMTDIQAAIGLSQLASLEEWNARRRFNAETLQTVLGGLAGIECPKVAPTRRHVFHQFTIRVDEKAVVDRDQLAAALRMHGIETGVYYPRAVSEYQCYRDNPSVIPMSLRHAELAARQVLSLPVHQWLTENDLEEIGEAMTSILGS